MSIVKEKFLEVLASLLPIVLLVMILNFTISPVPGDLFVRFLIGSLLILIGLTIFLIGVDRGVSPIGSLLGTSMTRSGQIGLLVIGSLILGFVISVAEPDLHILASEVSAVTSKLIGQFTMVIVVSIGIGVMMTIGMLRAVFKWSMRMVFLLAYGVIAIMSIFSIPEFQAIAFDASGATTGAMTTPFMLALLLGVSKVRKSDETAEEDSFGLVGISSSGAILGMLALGLLMGVDRLSGSISPETAEALSLWEALRYEMKGVTTTVVAAILPIYLIFLLYNALKLKVGRRPFRRIMVGGVFAWVGLWLFLLGVNVGFMEVGRFMGYTIAKQHGWLVVLIGFFLGFVTILAEPAVHVLTKQIEEVTTGYVPRKAVFASLCIGVGVAVALSMMRILVPSIQLWHYLLPGFGLAIVLMWFTPKLFIGMAYDSGGVASGPMAATFILAFANGVAEFVPTADVMVDGFGMIAVVAMTPIIALEILGVLFKAKQVRKERMNDAGQ